MLKAEWHKYVLKFSFPAGTSRGILYEKDTYYIFIRDENSENAGVGECGLLRGLSMDDRPGYEEKLTQCCQNINNKVVFQEFDEWPSIKFGLEMALKDMDSAEPFILFPTPFTNGNSGIDINGLIWMGDPVYMRKQIEEKLEAGFSCIKMKIGAIDWQSEVKLLKEIRNYFPAGSIELRVDANGAFTPEEALFKLDELSRLNIHSIEQPIKAGQWEQLAELCRKTPLPIALDEELIGIITPGKKAALMEFIKPQYIIVKPSLIGGFEESQEWIDIAEKNGISWWITSALESNIGLNAIAQWTYTFNNSLPQGLGTGRLYTNNIPSPLYIEKGKLFYRPEERWDLSVIG